MPSFDDAVFRAQAERNASRRTGSDTAMERQRRQSLAVDQFMREWDQFVDYLNRTVTPRSLIVAQRRGLFGGKTVRTPAGFVVGFQRDGTLSGGCLQIILSSGQVWEMGTPVRWRQVGPELSSSAVDPHEAAKRIEAASTSPVDVRAVLDNSRSFTIAGKHAGLSMPDRGKVEFAGVNEPVASVLAKVAAHVVDLSRYPSEEFFDYFKVFPKLSLDEIPQDFTH